MAAAAARRGQGGTVSSAISTNLCLSSHDRSGVAVGLPGAGTADRARYQDCDMTGRAQKFVLLIGALVTHVYVSVAYVGCPPIPLHAAYQLHY
jgi:hypothetical protein